MVLWHSRCHERLSSVRLLVSFALLLAGFSEEAVAMDAFDLK